jgi:cold shock CspA family protein
LRFDLELRKMRGIIKSYNPDRGFGFIASEGLPQNLFFHITFVQNPNPPPQFGQHVEFRLDKDHAGRSVARDVKMLDGGQAPSAPALPDRARRHVAEAAEALDLGKDRRRERRREAEQVFRKG